MVQRRERLKKQLLRNQLELIKLQGAAKLESSSGSSGDTELEVVSVEGGVDLEIMEEDEPCSPPSVRQTR